MSIIVAKIFLCETTLTATVLWTVDMQLSRCVPGRLAPPVSISQRQPETGLEWLTSWLALAVRVMHCKFVIAVYTLQWCMLRNPRVVAPVNALRKQEFERYGTYYGVKMRTIHIIWVVCVQLIFRLNVIFVLRRMLLIFSFNDSKQWNGSKHFH